MHSKLISLFDLTGRVAIVTGSSRGLGRAIAGGLARAGAAVVICSRKLDACVEAAREIEADGGIAFPLATNMTNPVAGRELVDATVERFGRLDIVVNNAATVLDRNDRLLRAYTTTDDTWRMPVEITDVDPRYIRMLLAFEDRRFHDHHGVDAIAVMRAVAQLARHGRIVSGGSTITMQVARLLERRHDRTAMAHAGHGPVAGRHVVPAAGPAGGAGGGPFSPLLSKPQSPISRRR